MRRQTSALFAAVLAGALVLAGCGSDDPPAAPSASAGGASPSAEAPATSDAASSEPAGSDAADSGAAGTDAAKSDDDSDPMGSESGSGDSSGSGSAAATEDAGTAGSEGTAGGAGNATGDDDSATEGSAGESEDDAQAGGDESSVAPIALDEASTQWFGTMCSGFAPILKGESALEFDDSKPFEAERDRIAGVYQEVGSQLSSVSGQLTQLPPPNIEGGDRLAPAVAEAFSAMGSEAQKQGASLAAVDDPAQFAEAVDAADDAMGDVSNQLGDGTDDVLEAPGVQEAIIEIPECAPLAGM